MQGLAGYVVRRLLWAPVILLAVSFVAFALGRYAPSDYVDLQAGSRARPEVKERIKEERGLNDPVWEQYGRWLMNFVQGDMGTSTRYRGVPIDEVILPRLWITVQYNAIALVLTFAIGIPLGTWAAMKRGSWMDPLSIGAFLFFASIPVLVTVPILQWLFAVKLGWLPTGGWENNMNILGIDTGIFSTRAILPAIALTVPGIAGLARYMRAQVIETLDQDYVRTARAKGLDETVVVRRHIIRNAFLPIVTLLGFELAGLLAGSIFLESLLGIPGIGQYAFDSINSRDYDGLMAIVMIGSTAFIFANLLVDIAYGFIDPRIRLAGRS